MALRLGMIRLQVMMVCCEYPLRVAVSSFNVCWSCVRSPTVMRRDLVGTESSATRRPDADSVMRGRTDCHWAEHCKLHAVMSRLKTLEAYSTSISAPLKLILPSISTLVTCQGLASVLLLCDVGLGVTKEP